MSDDIFDCRQRVHDETEKVDDSFLEKFNVI
jgi:hypothetical protein